MERWPTKRMKNWIAQLAVGGAITRRNHPWPRAITNLTRPNSQTFPTRKHTHNSQQCNVLEQQSIARTFNVCSNSDSPSCARNFSKNSLEACSKNSHSLCLAFFLCLLLALASRYLHKTQRNENEPTKHRREKKVFSFFQRALKVERSEAIKAKFT